jgi:diguanylate cyclase (GGDEF)-like protein
MDRSTARPMLGALAPRSADMAWYKQDLLTNLDRIAMGIAIVRLDGTLEHANAYLREMLGVRGGDLFDPSFSFLEAPAQPDGQDESRQRGVDSTGRRDLRVHTSNGKMLDVLHAVYPLCDDAGVVTHHVHLLQHSGDEQRLEKLSRLAFYDALTGLPNRNLFNDRLARALAVGTRNRSPFALLYIDIDYFKHVNDTFGHEAGDDLLCEVAARLTQSLRASDTVARWGGDEFVVILDGVTDQQSAARVASTLLAACGEHCVVRGHECRVTLSVGASFYPRDGYDAARLLQCADRAMHEAKARGRNGYRIEESPGNYGLTAA